MEPANPTTSPSATSRQWAMLAHLLTLLGYLVLVGWFVPPLVIWLSKKDEDEFVADQAKESLNFQITYLLASLLALALIVVLVITLIGIPLAVLIGLALPVAHVVLVILAGVKASDGHAYRYPFCLRFF